MLKPAYFFSIIALWSFVYTNTHAAEQYVLALSWQPTFCQNHQRQKVCRQQNKQDFDAKNFSLHGLWPQGASYCKVKDYHRKKDKQGRWGALPELHLSGATRSSLNKVMRGSARFLHRHEWIKHGTCDGRSPEQYYRLSLNLLTEFNHSQVQKLFAKNIGKKITQKQIKAAFEQDYGKGSAQALALRCRRGLIEELRIALHRPNKVDVRLKNVITKRKHLRSNCRSGIVDAAGF